jgi:hypothetical protein
MSQELGITPRSENYHNPYKNDPVSWQNSFKYNYNLNKTAF